jgi:hypothetical protein
MPSTWVHELPDRDGVTGEPPAVIVKDSVGAGKPVADSVTV